MTKIKDVKSIREIIEKYQYSAYYKGHFTTVPSENFDKLETDLLEWERRSNQLAVQKFVKNHEKH